MDWTGLAAGSMGVAERPFAVHRDGDTIPGILWAPEDATGAVPLVLLGHGGSSEKRNEAGLALARRFVGFIRRAGAGATTRPAPASPRRRAGLFPAWRKTARAARR